VKEIMEYKKEYMIGDIEEKINNLKETTKDL
jgi:hypothetical protein